MSDLVRLVYLCLNHAEPVSFSRVVGSDFLLGPSSIQWREQRCVKCGGWVMPTDEYRTLSPAEAMLFLAEVKKVLDL